MTEPSFGKAFILTLITNNIDLARTANDIGINRIGVDLEHLNKATRQNQFSTRLSSHSIEDLFYLSKVVDKSKLFARVNPISENSQFEIDQIVEAGVSHIMLPFFKTAQELDHFIRMVDGRALTIGLVETAPAIVRIKEILRVPGLNEVMLGLNDLRIGMGVHNHFEILCSPLIDMICAQVLDANLRLTLGGVAPPNRLNLPVDPGLVLAQYPRLGATGSWIARSLFDDQFQLKDLSGEITSIREELTNSSLLSSALLEQKRQMLEQLSRAARDHHAAL
jgi:hypothetical protein